jgi:hypothetical protein
MEGKFLLRVSMQFCPYFVTLPDFIKIGREEVKKILYLIERL